MTKSRPQIVDNHGRPLTYVRLAVTDRCNLRCFYCMPAEGIDYLPKKQLLTYEEMERLLQVLAGLGISKVRITGGEPFLRKDLTYFLRQVKAIPGIEEIHITTNGVLTEQYIPDLVNLGIKSVNLSLDTLDRERFHKITRRDEFEKVMQTYYALLANQISVKINAVVMEGQNIEDIVPLAALTKDHPVSVRFIEEMPFNGEGQHYPVLTWNYRKIITELQTAFPDLYKVSDDVHSTANHYAIPGYKGNIGVIAAFSRTFCGTCNRIRVTAQGGLKTCLYGNDVLNVKNILRSGASDAALTEELLKAFDSRAKDGYEAEAQRPKLLSVFESMSMIGG
ncbi:GTP 3',8-cyclase MoaA [Adhaeribacter radiodurans]|uniref:GTP 3',8-cyclase n=1 Tax=Adhaeribacter radiodurans TaxID=2745197 RepID=A0A7L7L2Y1_9BACT|nr:GTP 3',8-cyclase MoaA [Adhaeribacter radiodurans]QMU27157.1 GTP 3',8-cyclase MoaA [Adhaeribacter radiodurans]